MSRCIFLVVLGLVLFGQVSSSFGAALEGAGLGARQRIMGGAFIGLADDWTAIYWNPAGLARHETRGGGVEFDYVVLDGEDGNSVANPIKNPDVNNMNPDQGDIFFQFGDYPTNPDQPTEPTEFDRKDITVHVLLPGVGVYAPFRDFVIAGGIYEPIGYSSKWNDTKSGITADYEIELYEIVYNFSIAKQINPDLSLGAGLNIIQGKYKKTAKKTVPGVYDYSIEVDGDGFGCEQVIGLMYKLKPNIDIGAVYRTGGTVKLKGTGKAKHTLNFPPDFPVDESSDYTQEFEHPPTYGIGLAFRPRPDLVITTDWARTDWTTMRSHIDYDTPGTLLKDKDRDVDWKATDRFRIGAEYKLNDRWTIRGGIFTDPSPVPDKAVSLTNVIDVDFTFFGLGLGYNYKDCQIDFGMLLADNDRDADSVHYEKKSTSYLIGGRCRF